MATCRVPIRPRYGEVDSMGVVYHGHYLAYFDLGRTELMRALGLPYAELEKRGFRLAVVEVDIRYRRPAHYDQELELEVFLTAVGGATVGFEYALRDAGGALLATGRTKLGCLDTDNRPTRLPPDARALLRAGRTGAPQASEAP